MVRSVDIQQVLLQLNSIERVQQVQQQHPDVQQRYFEDQLSKEKKEVKEKVQQSEELEYVLIREEERRGKREEKHGKRTTGSDVQGTDDGDSERSVDELGGKVDIKV
ncbi:MAG: hypothetical protein JXC33_08250 [Deltaproteobacteria bacterium]|nr:hypothetical protein [Deltaproteobacteria bacterium]